METCLTKSNRFWLLVSVQETDRPPQGLTWFVFYIIENMDKGTFPDGVSFYLIWFMSLLGSFSPVTSFQEALTDRVLIKPCCLRFLLTYVRLRWALYQTKTFTDVGSRILCAVFNIQLWRNPKTEFTLYKHIEMDKVKRGFLHDIFLKRRWEKMHTWEVLCQHGTFQCVLLFELLRIVFFIMYWMTFSMILMMQSPLVIVHHCI